jgi:hypothetical protein
MQEDTEDFRIYNNCKFVSLNTIVAIFLCFKLRMLMIGKGIFFFHACVSPDQVVESETVESDQPFKQ